MPKPEELFESIGEGGIFRTRDLEALGISRSTVKRMVSSEVTLSRSLTASISSWTDS